MNNDWVDAEEELSTMFGAYYPKVEGDRPCAICEKPLQGTETRLCKVCEEATREPTDV